MTFLFPGVLWALVVLAIPILIHLFTFRKVKKIHFSTISFIDLVKDETESKNKLKHLLILLSRLLFLTFLILAFAQPSLKTRSTGLKSESSIFYLDNSLSLSQTNEEGTSILNEGVSLIEVFLKESSLDSRFGLLTNDFAPFSNQVRSKNEISDFLTELDYSGRTRTLESVFERLDNAVSSPKQRVIISDFQKSTTGLLESIQIDSAVQVSLLQISFASQLSNIYVDTAYLSKPFLLVDESNELKVIFRNTGEIKKENILVKLTAGGKLISSVSLTMLAFESKEVSFLLNTTSLPMNELVISFEDFPVTFDNEYRVALNLNPRPKISVINDNLESQYLGAVYQNQDLFDLTIYHSGNVDYTKVFKADLIVLNGFDLIPDWFTSQFQTSEADVVLVPSGNANLTSYRTVLPGLRLSTDSAMGPISIYDINNPFFNGLFDSDLDRVSFPKAKKLFSLPSTHEILLGDQYGRPYLSRRKGDRNTYAFASPLESNFTSMQEHAIFLPLMYRIAQQSAAIDRAIAFSIDERFISIPSRELSNNTYFQLKGEDQEFIPNVFVSKNLINIELPPSSLTPGFYFLVDGTGDTLSTLALNSSKKESDMRVYSQEELENAFSSYENISVLDYSSAEELQLILNDSSQSSQIWKYALILALMFLLTEILLVRFFR
ncbi:MAG: BatA domain-containing protein [Cyclobacteriaceae bacterium]|nr:BatA domain-containing protein [Cyclobacteriaceae bacterium HetDA_MAG_MS6]